MNYYYYPGCTLKTKAKALDASARAAAECLGVTLTEVPEWQCCGAVYPIAQDEIATRLSSVRALNSAKELGHPLLTLCSACHHVIKRVNEDMRANEDIRGKANRYLELAEPYAGETRVVHYLEMLRDGVGFAELKKKVVNPLKGRKIAAYYGCLLLRPNDVMQFDNPENPTILEDFIRAIGAEPVVSALRNECCGAYVALEDKSVPEKLAGRILDSMRDLGADSVITACPLCRYNLYTNRKEGQPPVYYFTELLAEALGVKEAN